MTAPSDPYAVLGVDRNADVATIKRAWRSIAKTLHPDVTGGQRDDEFARAHAAYALALTMATITPPTIASPSCSCVNVNITAATLHTLPGHNAWEHVPGPWREGSDISIAVHIDQAATGGTVIVPIITSRTCDTCSGTGTVVDHSTPCPSCHGKGRHNRAMNKCSVCSGTGYATADCSWCQATGTQTQSRSYRVVVPVDAADGMTTTLSRSGNPGTGGAAPGHLHITWHMPHPRT